MVREEATAQASLSSAEGESRDESVGRKILKVKPVFLNRIDGLL